MLAILTTHPIQYQVPLWQALARDGRVPFEVWYLTHHAVRQSHDSEFKKSFAWDLDLLHGYPHRSLRVPDGATPTTFARCRITEPLVPLLRDRGVRAVWIQGWQVAAYWQMAWAARRASCQLWLRGESNDLAPTIRWKEPIKRLLLGRLFSRVDAFLCIGTANRRFYRRYGVPESRLYSAPYAVDNERFVAQAAALRPQRPRLRRDLGIPDDAFCILFCGKFIPKKHPMELVRAAQLLRVSHPHVKIHLLFVGSGELGDSLRTACAVAFDADTNANLVAVANNVERIGGPPASFAGFLNQTEISNAYLAADCLVLPSDYGETWGLVVNEALASGLPCIVSDRCGSAGDLGTLRGNRVVSFNNPHELGNAVLSLTVDRVPPPLPPGFSATVDSVMRLYQSAHAS